MSAMNATLGGFPAAIILSYSSGAIRTVGQLKIVPRTPDESAVKVDSLNKRIGLATRRNESDLAELGLERAADHVSCLSDDIEGPLEVSFSLES